MRDIFQAERRFAHLRDTGTNGRGMFCEEVSMMAEGCFQFVDRLGRDACGQDVVQTAEDVMVAFVPCNASRDR